MSDLFMTVLRLSLHASIVAAAVILLRLVLKKAPRAMIVALWGLVVIRLIFPFAWEFRFSAVPEEIGSGEVIYALSQTPVGEYEIVTEEQPEYSQAVDAGAVPQTSEDGQRYVITASDKVSLPRTIGSTVIPVLSWIWLLGMGCMILYSAVSYGLLCRSVSRAVWEKENIYLGACVSSPFLLGLAKPRIYLPVDIPAEDVRFVVAHEQAHMARKDHWWKPLGFLLLSIHWFNPALWLSYGLFCKDVELACDARVAKSLEQQQLADYSQALLNCSVHKNRLLHCPLAFGEMSVKERVRQVLRYKKPGAAICVIGALVICVCGIFFLTGAAPKEAPEQLTPAAAEPSETTAPAAQGATETSLPRYNISGTYWIDDVTLFTHEESLLPFLSTLPDGGGAWAKCLRENELTLGALYVLNEQTGELTLIEERTVREYLQTREDYFYILQEKPNTIMRKDKASGTVTAFYSSDRGNITDISYYGYEDDGNLTFIVDKSYICTIKMPEKERILLYEDADNIDAIVRHSRERGMIEFRDVNWNFWDYYYETGELLGPFE